MLLTCGSVTWADGFGRHAVRALRAGTGWLEDDGVPDASSITWSCPCLPVQYHPCPRLPRRWTTGAPGIASICCARNCSTCSPRCATPRSARSALPAGGVAGDRDPGDRSGDARLCRVCDLGAHGAGGCVEPVGNPVPSTEREDVPIGPSAAGSRGSGSPAGRVLHRGGRSAGHPVRVAGGGLDGKTLRGARRAGAGAAHLVSVFAHHARLVLG